MKRLLIVQARTGSTRLPGKVLKDIGGYSMLARVVLRAQRSQQFDELLIATSTESTDDLIQQEAQRLGVLFFRGHELDVLDRFYQAAKSRAADVIVRVTADCPLIDPEIIDRVVAAFATAQPPADFAANTLTRTYPRGLDVEVSSFAALEQTWHHAREPYQRAHVFPFIYQNADRFKLLNVSTSPDHSHWRWTVDTQADLDFVRAVYAKLDHALYPSWRVVLELLAREPQLAALNRGVEQKSLAQG